MVAPVSIAKRPVICLWKQINNSWERKKGSMFGLQTEKQRRNGQRQTQPLQDFPDGPGAHLEAWEDGGVPDQKPVKTGREKNFRVPRTHCLSAVPQFCPREFSVIQHPSCTNSGATGELLSPTSVHTGFPGGSDGKESTCPCRRLKKRGFSPKLGRSPE